MLNTSRLAIALLAGLTILTADPSHAQLKRFLRRVITDTVGSELTNQFNRVVRESIRCAVRDPMCYRRATAAGHDVVFYGDSGDIIQNDEGLSVQKPADLPADYQAAYGERLDDVQGSSVPTAAGALQRSGVLDRGYDFEPGSRELVYEDYSQDRVGDFPRGLEFRRGDISVVAVDGRRVLMVRGDGELDLPLSETLPEQFTLEFEVRATRPLPNG